MAIIHHPQSRANLLREMLRRDPAVRRTGIRFLEVEGGDDALRVLVRQGARTARLGRGPEWREQPLDRLKQSLRAELTRLPGSVRRRRRAAPSRRPPRRRTRTSGAEAVTPWLLAPARRYAPVMAEPRGPPEPA